MAGVSLSYAPLALPSSYRRYMKNEGEISFGSGNTVKLDQDGLLLGIIIRFSGTVVTGATAPVLQPGPAPWNIATPTVSVAGPGTPVLLPGELLNQFAQEINPQYLDKITWLPATPAASTTYPVEFGYYIPICVRDQEFMGEPADHVGSIFTGDGKVSVYIGLRPNVAGTGVWFTVPGNATVSGNWGVYSVKLDTPSPDKDASLLQAISWYHGIQIDLDDPLTAVGQQVWKPTVNTVRTYLRLLTFFRNNAGAGDTSLASAAFTGGMMSTLGAVAAGIINWWDTIPEDVQLAYQQLQHRAITGGVYDLDLSRGGSRDQWLDVSNVTSLTITEQMNAVTLAAAKFQTLMEFLEPSPLAQRWFQTAPASVLKQVTGA